MPRQRRSCLWLGSIIFFDVIVRSSLSVRCCKVNYVSSQITIMGILRKPPHFVSYHISSGWTQIDPETCGRFPGATGTASRQPSLLLIAASRESTIDLAIPIVNTTHVVPLQPASCFICPPDPLCPAAILRPTRKLSLT